MSAYIVSDLHISGIVGFAVAHEPTNRIFHYRAGLHEQSTPVRVGQVLLEENYRSVNHRYDESDLPRQFYMDWGLAQTPINPVACLSMIAGLDYQSCESDDWEETEAYSILQAIKSIAIRRLPGYGDYPSSLDNGDDVRAARKPFIHRLANGQTAQPLFVSYYLINWRYINYEKSIYSSLHTRVSISLC